ncbi:MAG TPA: hypothetical protein PLQ85_05170 [Anaerolineae bacterium]|nr:hypothetical protein [Anaerolineae bacterium]HUM36243.1 hypothetical protein [Anaerolineae bacterium]
MRPFYPSYQALALMDQLMEAIGKRVPGYQGRVGACWYWRLPGGILVTFALNYSVTEQRWDILEAEAATPRAGIFNAASFPFAAYGTLVTSPPFIHDLDGEAEWANRLYFQTGYLIEDAIRWLSVLTAAILDPQVQPPASFPQLTALECELVRHALNALNGHFQIKALHAAFGDRISQRELSRLAQRWEDAQLLTEAPRRVTVALRVLAETYAP